MISYSEINIFQMLKHNNIFYVIRMTKSNLLYIFKIIHFNVLFYFFTNLQKNRSINIS